MNNDTNLKPGIRVFLDIRGFRGKPSGITKLLGIEPNNAWSKGDVIPENPMDAYYKGLRPRTRKYNCWSIEASLKHYSYNMEDYVKYIIKRIFPVRNKIKAIRGVNLMLCVFIDLYPGASIPAIVLGPETIRFLSETEAKLASDRSLICEKGGSFD